MKQQPINDDLWFQRQLDIIGDIRPHTTPDVTNAVMQRINGLPSPLVIARQKRRRRLTLVSTLAAACFAGLIIPLTISGNHLQAANQPQPSSSISLYDIYSYCNDYTDVDSDDAAFYDNPVSNFI